MDRAEKLAKEINEKVTWNKDELREWIMENNVKEGYFVQHSETNEVDASLLTLPLYGFCSINDPVFLKTLKKIESDLVLNGYVKRYRFDSLGEARYPFSVTTIWLARVYNMLGRDSSQIIKNVFKPPLYLAGEHIDHVGDEYSGNYPQAFVHAEGVIAIDELLTKNKK